MNTYYIPTSTLNFNNIFSSESISPKSFYAERGFGYGRWQTVEENRFDDIILLYDNAYEFSRPESDLEDHPMLIKIRTDEVFDKIQDGVYKAERTIYLDPSHTRIIFFSEEDKRTALIRSENSLETKLVRLYERCLVVERPIGTFPPIDSCIIGGSSRKEELISEDRKINKMKGLLYGYYIGAFLSTTVKKVEKLSILREINNIFKSILSSPSGEPSPEQRRRLDDLFDNLKFTHPLFNNYRETFGKKTAEEIISINAQHGYIPYQLPVLSELLNAMQKIIKDGKSTINIREEYNKVNPIEWINKELRDAELEVETSRKKLPIGNDIELLVFDKKLDYIRCFEDGILKDLYINCVNDIFSTSKYNGKISTFKTALADAITYKARDICGSKWQDSNIRTYLNELRRHLAGGDFSQPWDNGPLSSFAAVLIKGDDWEALLQFMQSKGMWDYRLAFSIYGVLNGFANLTRDFTDNLITLEREYVWDIYREFYGELFGKELVSEQRGDSSGCELIQPSEYEVDENPTYSYERQAVNNGGLQMSQIRYPIKEDITTDVKNDKWEDVCDQIWSFFDKNIKTKTKKDKEKLRASLSDVLKQHSNLRALFDALLEKETWRTPTGKPSKYFNVLQNYFFQHEPSRKTSDFQLYGSLLKNASWIEVCCEFITTEEAKEEFRENANFLVCNYTGSYTCLYKNKPKDNKSVRRHLINLIQSECRKKHIEYLVKEMNLDKVGEYLERAYGD